MKHKLQDRIIIDNDTDYKKAFIQYLLSQSHKMLNKHIHFKVTKKLLPANLRILINFNVYSAYNVNGEITINTSSIIADILYGAIVSFDSDVYDSSKKYFKLSAKVEKEIIELTDVCEIILEHTYPCLEDILKIIPHYSEIEVSLIAASVRPDIFPIFNNSLYEVTDFISEEEVNELRKITNKIDKKIYKLEKEVQKLKSMRVL